MLQSINSNLLSGLMCECLVTKSCPTLCDLIDNNLPDSSVYGLLQVRILDWVAISSSSGSSQHKDQTCDSWFETEGFSSVSCIAGRFLKNYKIMKQ